MVPKPCGEPSFDSPQQAAMKIRRLSKWQTRLLPSFLVLAFLIVVWHIEFDPRFALREDVIASTMRRIALIAANCFTFLGETSAYNVYDLGRSKWTVSDPGNNVSVPGHVPSQVRQIYTLLQLNRADY